MSDYHLDFESLVLAAAADSLSDEPAARTAGDAVEFRLDLTADPLAELAAYDGDLPVIVTNRPTWEGGEATDEHDRLALLENALEYEAVSAVDLELRALDGTADAAATPRAREVRAAARERGVPVIASVHDFEKTPPVEELSTLLERGSDAGEVAKLATTATCRADALSLLQATHRAADTGMTVATMAMGSPGRHTRVAAPLYGSVIGYGPVDPAAATAPGQYPLATLRRLIGELQ